MHISMHGVHGFLKGTIGIYHHGRRLFSGKLCHNKVRLTDLLNDWIKKFEAEGIPDSTSSAEYISAHALGKKTLHNINTDNLCLDHGDVVAINNLSRLRLRRMPVQYILGEWDFDGMTLKMAPPVFIPRPETEELVDHCKDILKSCYPLWKERPLILELGCGTGAISLALLNHFKELQAVSIDILPEACALTKTNAQNVGVEDRIRVVNGDFMRQNVISELHALGPFCLLVSNPPYVTLDEMKNLSLEIDRFESPVALSGGVDGLDLVRYILNQAPNLVMPHGHLFLEVGESHPGIIENFVTKSKSSSLQFISGKKDMYGRNRFCHLEVCDK